jgi:GcrA cell cycle regulator
MEWGDETIERLRALWNEGLSTGQIANQMGISKNAVVGKAHRLGLPARPSPIRRDGTGTPTLGRPRRVTGPTLPQLATQALAPPIVPPVGLVEAVPEPTQVEPPPEPPAMPALPPVARVVPRHSPRASACCWPVGDPGTKAFRFCCDKALPGKPYCAEHAAIAYVKVKDLHDSVAA